MLFQAGFPEMYTSLRKGNAVLLFLFFGRRGLSGHKCLLEMMFLRVNVYGKSPKCFWKHIRTCNRKKVSLTLKEHFIYSTPCQWTADLFVFILELHSKTALEHTPQEAPKSLMDSKRHLGECCNAAEISSSSATNMFCMTNVPLTLGCKDNDYTLIFEYTFPLTNVLYWNLT